MLPYLMPTVLQERRPKSYGTSSGFRGELILDVQGDFRAEPEMIRLILRLRYNDVQGIDTHSVRVCRGEKCTVEASSNTSTALASG
jgi:hypothetical protein